MVLIARQLEEMRIETRKEGWNEFTSYLDSLVLKIFLGTRGM